MGFGSTRTLYVEDVTRAGDNLGTRIDCAEVVGGEEAWTVLPFVWKFGCRDRSRPAELAVVR